VEVQPVSGPQTPAAPAYTPNGTEMQQPLSNVAPNHTVPSSHPVGPNGSEMTPSHGPTNATGLESAPNNLPPNATTTGPGAPLQTPAPLNAPPMDPTGGSSFFVPPVVPPYFPKNKQPRGDGPDEGEPHQVNSTHPGSGDTNGTHAGSGGNNGTHTGPTNTNPTGTDTQHPNTNPTSSPPGDVPKAGPNGHPIDPTLDPGPSPIQPQSQHDPFFLVGGARRRRSSSSSRRNSNPPMGALYSHAGYGQGAPSQPYGATPWSYGQGGYAQGLSPVSSPPPASELSAADASIHEAPSQRQNVELAAGGVGNRSELLGFERIGELGARGASERVELPGEAK
jgi:hypothetical protein